MRILKPGQESSVDSPISIALGNFDGLHLGHMQLINKAISIKKNKQHKSLVYTFYNHPSEMIPGKAPVLFLTDNDKKAEILKETDLDYLYFETFNTDIMSLSPIDFFKKLLLKKFKIESVIVGFDYRFGYKGEGDTEILKNIGKEYNFNVDVIPPVRLNNRIVSSSIIRECILSGDMETAGLYLDRLFSIKGRVVKGKGLGNEIGFPTANLTPKLGIIIPVNGVYRTKVLVKKNTYNSITNIGVSPTVDGNNRTIETHIIDYHGDLYGEEMEVFFEKKIRGEKKFDNIDELSKQILKDVECVR
jgi:riboflavin kinase/FMN adenylyltransferase